MSEQPSTYSTTPSVNGRYDFESAQVDDWLNEYRSTIQRVRWLQEQLLRCGAIKRGVLRDK